MNDQLTATIIPFPVRTRSGVPTAALASPAAAAARGPMAPPRLQVEARDLPHTLASSAQRLTSALNGLSNALADQREATQRWKSALEDLANKMRTLGEVDKFGKNAG